MSCIRIRDLQYTNADVKLYLVDLVGSEAARDIAIPDGKRMQETRKINISLSGLKNCIRIKAELDVCESEASHKAQHVSMRLSILTEALKLVEVPRPGWQGKTVAIVYIKPSSADVQSSKNMLLHAEMRKAPKQAV